MLNYVHGWHWLSSLSISFFKRWVVLQLKKIQFQLCSGALKCLCWWLQTGNLWYIVLNCHYKEGEMHTVLYYSFKEDFAEEGKYSRGKRGPTGENFEKRGKHFKQWSPSCLFFFFTVPPPQGPGVDVKQAKPSAHSVLKQVDQQTVKCFLLGRSKHQGYCALH